MYLALYKGKSITSKVVKWRTVSEYSHISILYENGSIIESWKNGVQKQPALGTLHLPNTEVDIFKLKEPLSSDKYLKFNSYLNKQIGKSYDWSVIFIGFPIHNDYEKYINKNKWFCSSLIESAFRKIKNPLVSDRCPLWRVMPEDFNKSQKLQYVKTIFT